MDDSTDNPMQPANLANAPRCGARTRSGRECRSPAVRGRQRCRMHGGTNSGAPMRNRNAWKHGNRSAEAEEQLQAIRSENRDLRLMEKCLQGLHLRFWETARLLEMLDSRLPPYGDQSGGDTEPMVESPHHLG